MPEAAPPAAVTEAEIRRLRDLLARREADRRADDLLQDAANLVKQIDLRGGQGLRNTQLSNLQEIALARGSIEDIKTFVNYQSRKEGSRATWLHGNFASGLAQRLDGSGLIARARDQIVEAVREQLRAHAAEERLPEDVIQRLTDDRGWRRDLLLPLARRYIGYVTAEYRLAQPPGTERR